MFGGCRGGASALAAYAENAGEDSGGLDWRMKLTAVSADGLGWFVSRSQDFARGCDEVFEEVIDSSLFGDFDAKFTGLIEEIGESAAHD
jgi:hypothetical protein